MSSIESKGHEMPPEELERINTDAHYWAHEQLNEEYESSYVGYTNGAKAEYLRAHSFQPDGPNALNIVSRAAVYLRDMKADDVHDPSVGLRRDMELVQLVDDVEEFLKRGYKEFPSSTPTVEPLIEILKKREKSVARVANEFPYWEGSRDTFRWLIKHLQGEPNDNFPEDHIPDFDAVEPAVETEKKYSRSELFQIVGHWSHDMLSSARVKSMSVVDWSDLFNDWFEREYPSSSTPTADLPSVPHIPDSYHPLPAMVRINGKESWRLLVPIVGYTDAWNAIGAVAGECDEVRRENILYWAKDQPHD